MNIELSDLMTVCVVLDQVIKQRRAEEEQYLDQIRDKPVDQLQAQFIVIEDFQIDELSNLRDRLFNQIPPEML